MAYFDCIVGGSGKGNTLVVTCVDDLAGATITCTNGTKTYTKTCPSTAPYEVTFYGLAAGTWTVSATVSGDTYTTTVVITDYEAELGGFNWKAWVDLSQNYTSSDFTDLDDLLSDETAVRELMTIHACVDYLAGIATESADVETIIGNDLCAKWINLRDYALDTLYANEIIAGYMDIADKYFYGEWTLVGQVPTMTSNNAPYGEAIASGEAASGYAAWKAFDNVAVGTADYWGVNVSTGWLGYHFVNPVIIKRFTIRTGINTTTPTYGVKTFKIEASNDGFVNDVHELSDIFTFDNAASEITADIQNDTAYLYYRVNCLSGFTYQGETVCYIAKLQFYAWQPKGNVPVMTSNIAPYGEVVGSSVLNSGTYYYSAFDGDESSVWHSAAGMPQYIGYKATNPIKLKACRVVVPPVGASYPNTKETFKIQGSNDGFVNDVHDLTETQEIAFRTDDICSVLWVEVDSEDYYLHHRVYVTDSTYQSASYKYARFRALQFYGRELSVSVPTMTSNTTPYGEASASAELTGYSAYKAFDGTNTGEGDSWYSQGVKTGYLRYKFTAPCCVKLVTMRNRNYGSTAGTAPSTFEIRGSNDNFVSDDNLLGTFTNTNIASNGFSKYDIINNDEYLYYEIKVLGTVSDNNVSIGQLQFYGKDYSEKEFEEGTTKKWLYDHGVELETIHDYSTGSYQHGSSSIYMEQSTSGYVAIAYAELDTSLYNLARVKVGSIIANTVYIRAYTPTIASLIGGATYLSSDMPNNGGYDISSVNGVNDIGVAVLGVGKCELKELWLE